MRKSCLPLPELSRLGLLPLASLLDSILLLCLLTVCVEACRNHARIFVGRFDLAGHLLFVRPWSILPLGIPFRLVERGRGKELSFLVAVLYNPT
jgi:hypothetical protein